MNTKSKLFFCVVEEFDKANNLHVTPQMIENYFNEQDYYDFYAFALHDEPNERKHYHIFIQTTQPYAKNTILNDLARELVFDKNCVSVRVAKSASACVRYLIHKDNPEKHPYDRKIIYSNDDLQVDNIIAHSVSELDIDIPSFIQLCQEADTIAEVYSIIGLKNSRVYRNVINDIFYTFHNSNSKKGKRD